MAELNEVYSVKTITRIFPAVGNAANGINITHWQVFAITGTGANNAAIANTFGLVFSPNYLPLLSTLSQFIGVICQRVLPVPVLIPFGSTAGAGPGTSAGEPLPFQTCGIITKREIGVGRRKRGRLYIPWPTEPNNTIDGEPSGLYVGNLNTLAGIMSAGVIAGVPPNQTTFLPVLFHPSPPPGTVTPVATAFGRNYWGTQRRRSGAFRADTPITIPPA